MAESSEMKSNQDAQQTEINSLSGYFKDNIRILSSIGQFSYILKIPAQQYGVSLTLQLDGKYQKERTFCSFDYFYIVGSYPSKPPEIIITAPRLIPGQNNSRSTITSILRRNIMQSTNDFINLFSSSSMVRGK